MPQRIPSGAALNGGSNHTPENHTPDGRWLGLALGMLVLPRHVARSPWPDSSST